jgi:hypothetical protein
VVGSGLEPAELLERFQWLLDGQPRPTLRSIENSGQVYLASFCPVAVISG